MYIATGSAFYAVACLLSIRSLRQAGCRELVVVATDLPDFLWRERDDLGYAVLRPEPHAGCRPVHTFEAWSQKMRLHRYSPFRRTLFLDCDTVVRAPLDGLWEAMAGSVLALTYDRVPQVGWLRQAYPSWGNPRDWAETVRVCGTAAPHYNVGVFAWERHPAAERLFERWHAEWAKYRSTDQCPLIRALHLSGLCPAVLPEESNAQRPGTPAYDRAVIRHLNGCRSAYLA